MKKNRLLFFVCALTLAELLLLLFIPQSAIISHLAADDFFYYLKIAANSAAGRGISADGLEPTNGFHPLYFGILRTYIQLTHLSPETFMRTALCIPLLFHNFFSLLVPLCFDSTKTPAAARLAPYAWLLNPCLAYIALQGVEAPLATFFCGAAVVFFLKQGTLPAPALSTPLFLSFLSALAVLSRTDSALLLPCLAVAYALIQIKKGAGLPLLTLHAAGAIAVFAGMTAPWWIWNAKQFGSLLQVSGQALAFTSHALYGASASGIAGAIVQSTVDYSARLFLYVLPSVGALLLCLRPKTPRSFFLLTSETRTLLAACAFFALLLLLWYCAWMWHVQLWYLHSSAGLLFLCSCIWLTQCAPEARPAAHRRSALAGAILSGLLLIPLVEGQVGHPLQRGCLELSSWLSKNTSPEDRVGAWNSGCLAYTLDRTVINLDGVVNNDLYRYLRRRKSAAFSDLDGYIRERGIRYITDYEPILPRDLSAFSFELAYHNPQSGLSIFRRK